VEFLADVKNRISVSFITVVLFVADAFRLLCLVHHLCLLQNLLRGGVWGYVCVRAVFKTLIMLVGVQNAFLYNEFVLNLNTPCLFAL
jgi:hypothetical protein